MAVNTRIQLRRGTKSQWETGLNWLAEGEIGYETDTGRFKIGPQSGAYWSSISGYAGGSALVSQSGIGFTLDQASNAYTLYSVVTGINGGQDGITFQSLPLSGLLNNTSASGTYYRIGLSTKLENFHDLSGSGIVSQDGSSFNARTLTSSNNNISITNGNGVNGDPTFALNSSLTGLSSISGNSTGSLNIISYSGINLEPGNSIVNISGDLWVHGTTTLNDIDIVGLVNITSDSSISMSANPLVLGSNDRPDVYFNTTPKVGPTGGTLGTNLFPVSLSGHIHTTGDIINFCSGVANCVDTALIVSTGLRSDFSSGTNTLQLALSGQAATLHSFTGSGLLARTAGPNNNGTFAARSIAQGTNITVTNGDGISANPTVTLNSSITGLTDVKSSNFYATTLYPNAGQSSITINSDVGITGNLTVSNLTVTGTTTTVNSTSITVQDPVIVLGGTGTISADNLDRGILLRYWDGSAAATGFMGLDYTSKEFTFLSSITGTINGNDYGQGTLGTLKAGLLSVTGSVTSNSITVTGATASTLATFDANKNLVSYTWPTLTAGSGLASTTTAIKDSPTINIGQGDGISVSADAIAVDATVVRTSGSQTVSGVKTFVNAIQFGSGITSSGTNNIQAASTSTSGAYYPVFINDPNSTAVQLYSRTLAQTRTDLGSSLNTASTLVLRDSNGNFVAGTVSGTLAGNATTSTNSTSSSGIYISGIDLSLTSSSLLLVSTTGSTSNSQSPFIDSNLRYNPSGDILSLSNISGYLTSTYNGYSGATVGTTSLSGLVTIQSNSNAGSYLHNFIIDGGTP